MRRVARSLDVAPMRLYTYVPGKAELLDLMLDASYAQMPRADTTGQPWRERLTAVAEENQALLEAHHGRSRSRRYGPRWVPGCSASTSTSYPPSTGSA